MHLLKHVLLVGTNNQVNLPKLRCDPWFIVRHHTTTLAPSLEVCANWPALIFRNLFLSKKGSSCGQTGRPGCHVYACDMCKFLLTYLLLSTEAALGSLTIIPSHVAEGECPGASEMDTSSPGVYIGVTSHVVGVLNVHAITTLYPKTNLIQQIRTYECLVFNTYYNLPFAHFT